MQEMQQGVLGK